MVHGMITWRHSPGPGCPALGKFGKHCQYHSFWRWQMLPGAQHISESAASRCAGVDVRPPHALYVDTCHGRIAEENEHRETKASYAFWHSWMVCAGVE
jgi:hypothetical protein